MSSYDLAVQLANALADIARAEAAVSELIGTPPPECDHKISNRAKVATTLAANRLRELAREAKRRHEEEE